MLGFGSPERILTWEFHHSIQQAQGYLPSTLPQLGFTRVWLIDTTTLACFLAGHAACGCASAKQKKLSLRDTFYYSTVGYLPTLEGSTYIITLPLVLPGTSTNV